jgi:tRNA dimethylallyltransferase
MLSPEGLEEVNGLLERQLDPALPVMRAIGVPQVAAFTRGQLTRKEALLTGQAATRQYAKRQYTWFRRQPPDNWPRLEEPLDGEEALERALNLLHL